MDWLKDFALRFADDKDLMDIKKKKIHGSLKINFCDGVPVNCELTIHKR